MRQFFCFRDSGRKTVLRAVNIKKDYQLGEITVHALKGVSFDVYERELVVIITHNADIAKIADRVFRFKDGMLESVEVNSSPMSPEEIEW